MQGYKKMVKQILELTIFLVAFVKETFLFLLPTNLAKSLNYFWHFLTSAGDWIGYIVAAAYYMAEDQGYGAMMCEYSGYGYLVIYYLHMLIDFSGASSN